MTIKSPIISLFCLLLMCSASGQTTQDISSGAARTIYDVLRTVPGIDISISNSLKEQPQVYVRDARNMRGKVAALFVVDNAIYDGDISVINPIDVASVTVLKDAAAASAFGSRAFGGVIIIKTKSGKGYIPPAVTTYEKSAYQYFITKGTELKVIGKDGKPIASGVITRETDSSIFLRKKEIHKRLIEKVEMIIN